MFTGPRRPRGGSDARVTRPSAVHRFGEGQLSAFTADRESRSDLGLFFGATFGFSWLMWAMALAAGGRIDQTTPYVLFVVGAFGPTLVAAALWLAGRRRPRGRRPFRHVHRWLPAALLLGAAPALTAALLTGSFDLQAAGQQGVGAGWPARGRRVRAVHRSAVGGVRVAGLRAAPAATHALAVRDVAGPRPGLGAVAPAAVPARRHLPVRARSVQLAGAAVLRRVGAGELHDLDGVRTPPRRRRGRRQRRRRECCTCR